MPTGWFAGGKWEVGTRVLLEESYLYNAMCLRTKVYVGCNLVFQINLLCDPESPFPSLNLPELRGLEAFNILLRRTGYESVLVSRMRRPQPLHAQD
jgi:hypothetical protein